MWVHWWDIEKGILIDGGKGQPGKRVAIRSEHHKAAPGKYTIFERVPKWIRGDKRFNPINKAAPDLWPGQAPSSSYFWSNPWELAAPRNERGVAEYQAFPDDVEPFDPEVVAYSLRCAELFIERERRTGGFHIELDPTLAGPAGSLHLGSIGAGTRRDTVYRGSAPIDPEVEVQLVQGGALARHLVDVARAFQVSDAEPFEFSPESVTYFAGLPFDVPVDTVEAEIGPDVPLRVHVDIGDSDDVRSAFAVMMHNRETGATAISEPTFLTSVRGSVIATDVPADMLSSGSTSALLALADAEGDLDLAAAALGVPAATAWSTIEVATEELGADCVADAMAFVRYSNEAPQREPVLV